MSEPAQDSRSVYLRRLDGRRASVAEELRIERRLSVVRLALVALGLILAWPVLIDRSVPWPWLLAPVVGFVAALVVHERVIRRRTRNERAVRFYELGLDRLDDRWVGQGTPGNRFVDPAHPYSSDLDIFGRGSLFELLCLSRTPPGQRTLADWLRAPAAPPEIRGRQEAVDELRDEIDLREDLAVVGEEVGEELDPDHLVRWSEGAPIVRGWLPPVLAGLLGLSNLATTAVWAWSMFGFLEEPTTRIVYGPLLISLFFTGIFVAVFRGRVERVLGAVERPSHELGALARVVEQIEKRRFRSVMLADLRRGLDGDGKPPSARIGFLARLVEVNESRGNMIFSMFAGLVLVGSQLAFAMERWRETSGGAVRRWLDAVGRFEAVASLSGFACEHPGDPFPEIEPTGPCIVGTAMAHPMLPAARSVANDVEIGPRLRLMMISGSNMSGKSTFLRTVGVNTVLALAGATVRAERLRVSPLSIGACMRVQDSLQEGLSHFYAEITRLRQVVEIGDSDRPLLFLLDEILHGTNSHDRRIGAQALVRGLVERGGVGLVTTHDLALARIADGLGDRAANMHFVDHLEGSEIRFDYQLRPGVVEKSNALSLMRAVGLDV